MRWTWRFFLLATVAALTACVSGNVDREFRLDSGDTVRFTGERDDGLFVQGRAHYVTAKQETVFEGKFDAQGFPHSGTLEQRLAGAGGQTFTLKLMGEFKLDPKGDLLAFDGNFTLADNRGRLLAEGRDSHWQAHYSRRHPHLAPEQFSLAGEHRYRQYRRHIPLRNDRGELIKIHRALPGPFLVTATYRDGRPRGDVTIAQAGQGAAAKTVERQFHSEDGAAGNNNYFYYAPESFTEIDLLGECQNIPTLTVPQDLLQAFAYDCEQQHFLAISPVFDDALLRIAAKDVDNSGNVRRLSILQRNRHTNMQIDPEALYAGKLRPHGIVLETHSGELREYQRYQRGHSIGVGIVDEGQGPRYRRATWPEADADMPLNAVVADLEQLYQRRRGEIESLGELIRGSVLSAQQLATLKDKLIANFSRETAMEGMESIAGVQMAQQRWQARSLAQLRAWNPNGAAPKARGLSELQANLSAGVEAWWRQTQHILQAQGRFACGADGKTLDAERWTCIDAPAAQTQAVCEQYYGAAQCRRMHDAFMPLGNDK